MKTKKASGRCVVFDLDGTLVDSRADLANSVNIMREELGLAPLPLEKVVSFVGNGMRKLVERALEGEAADIDDAIASMSSIYRENLLEKTTLYPGVFEGVNRLKELGWSLGLISNKPTEFCRIILDHFRIELPFSAIIGGGPEFPLKPDPASLNFIVGKTGSDAASSWIMGDNYTDLEAGTRAGMKRCYAAFGFGDPGDKAYDLKVGSFAEFVEALEKES
jgi:phosphoglycolate phosphatase